MTKHRWFLFTTVAILFMVVGGYYFYDQNRVSAQIPPESVLQTATVRRGNLVVSATGAGSVIPSSEINLGFRTAGVLTELNVQVGDKVSAGEVLARIDDIDAQAQLLQVQLSLQQAELQLQQLLADADAAAIASAQATLASAKADLVKLQEPASDEEITAARENLKSAQEALSTLLAGPSDDEIAAAKADLDLAQITLQEAQSAYDQVSWRSDVGQLPQASALQQATINYQKAKANYDLKTIGPSNEQIAAARAKVASAQAQLDNLLSGASEEDLAAAEARVAQAQAQLDELVAGASDMEVQLAQLNVQQAQNNVTAAERTLAETQLLASQDGVVTVIKAEVGENVGASPIITLADLNRPLLEIFLDETDLDKIGVDYEVEVVFDAFPDDTFVGTVTQVDPSLQNSGGTSVVRALVSLNKDSFAKPLVLPIGLNATIEVIGGRATNALLVPVEALREISPGQYAVFVMENGEPQLRMVEVGLMDFAFAEIKSGLEAGDVVSTGIVETQ